MEGGQYKKESFLPDELHARRILFLGKEIKEPCLKQLFRVFSCCYQGGNLFYCSFTVGSVCYTEPFAGSVEHFYRSGTFVDELIHHQRDEELGLQVGHVLRIGEERLEVVLAIVEIVGRESPYVHRDRRVVGRRHPLVVVVLILHGAVPALYLRALHDGGQVALGVGRADATRYRSVLAERIAHAETHHRIAILAALGELGEILTDDHEGVAVVEVVAVDDAERLLDDVLGHQYGVVGAPRFHGPRAW